MTARPLEIASLGVELGRPARTILDDVTLGIDAGEIVGLIGETGSGKSTLARAVLGLAPIAAGTVHAGGVDVGGLRRGALRAHRRRGTVQYVFQDPLRSLDPDFTARRSILEGVPRTLDRAARHAVLDRVLDEVGLDAGLAARRPAALSGGQRQRVAIARALAVQPSVLLADEPVSALDAASRVEILDLLRDVTTRERTATLLITHDIGSLIDVADRVAVLLHGRIVEQGPTADVLGAPQHPYTSLLVASVPPLHGDPLPAARRRELRSAVDELQTHD